ncbi:hypothetical protein AZ78_4134 [Lysobacter capsici AZ78]|uniref:Uncharacterized protein n=1 Tax=Lysobacter capsici AZ78 TaxID=1444315 RepID=A0A125MNH4_9GAMM|nr:hypothetical protein AZ78_4134 [Lysobacter capsici AZ78]
MALLRFFIRQPLWISLDVAALIHPPMQYPIARRGVRSDP